jgi:hypothetical protein
MTLRQGQGQIEECYETHASIFRPVSFGIHGAGIQIPPFVSILQLSIPPSLQENASWTNMPQTGVDFCNEWTRDSRSPSLTGEDEESKMRQGTAGLSSTSKAVGSASKP